MYTYYTHVYIHIYIYIYIYIYSVLRFWISEGLTYGKAELCLFVGFLLFNRLFHNFAGIPQLSLPTV